MPRVKSFEDLALRPVEHNEELWRWLYTELRAAMLDGRLRAGSRVPSSRSLSEQHGIARGTVVAALNQLKAEGYVVTESGSGTHVAQDVSKRPSETTPSRANPVRPSRASLSKRTLQALKGAHLLPNVSSIGRAFRSYEPAIDLFPVELWARISSRVLRHAPRILYGQGNAYGYMPLRKAISDMWGRHAGSGASPSRSSSRPVHSRGLISLRDFFWTLETKSGWKTRDIRVPFRPSVPLVQCQSQFQLTGRACVSTEAYSHHRGHAWPM